MNNIYALIILSIFTFSCSPKLGSAIIAKQEPLVFTDVVLIIDENDNYDNAGIEIGTIKSGDAGFSVNCDYKTAIEKLKVVCRQNGANVMKITEHLPPDQWSSCDRIRAKIFRVQDYRLYQKKIDWTNQRKLNWKDFKGKPEGVTDVTIGASTNCGFSLVNNTDQGFGDENLYVKNTFNCKSSWVRSGITNQELLAHEQGHFDLSEVYARLLRKKLTENNLIVFHKVNESSMIFNEIYAPYLERQKLYDAETNNGLNAQEQLKWRQDISSELAHLQLYFENN